jgi:ABC-2 type transport system permease protein
MIKYYAFFLGHMQSLLQYREAAISGTFVQVFFGLLRIYLLKAFYASSTLPPPMPFEQAVIYVWLVEATLRLAPFAPDTEIVREIRSGQVAYELIKPMDLYFIWLSRSLASKIAPTLLRFFPVAVISSLFFGFRGPSSGFAFFSWLLTICMAVVLSSVITNLLNISLLWTISGEGISQLMIACSYLLSGQMIPLAIFPDTARDLIRYLPFAGIIDLPNRFYLGELQMEHLLPSILFQLAWILLLWFIGYFILRIGLRKLVVQGG